MAYYRTDTVDQKVVSMSLVQLYFVVGLFASLIFIKNRPSSFVSKLLVLIPFWSVVLIIGLVSQEKK